MRILLVSGLYPPAMCGVGDYTLQLALALSKCPDVQVGLLTHSRIDPCDCKVEQILTPGAWTIAHLWAICKRAKEWQPDVVHIQHPSLGYTRSASIIAFAFFCGLRFKLIVTLHEALRWMSLPWFLSFVLNAHAIIYVRHNYLDLISRFHQFILRLRPHFLIPNASSIPKSHLSREEKEKLRESLLNNKKRLLAFFGLIFRVKGIENILKIMNPQSDHLLIIGGSTDESYLNELKATIEALKLTQAVSLTGALPADQVANLLACSDALVLPFLNGAGPWNTSVHAGLAQGSLVITTSSGQTQSDSDRNLFYVQTNDSESMLRVLNTYAGRKVNPDNVDKHWHQIASKHLDVYKS